MKILMKSTLLSALLAWGFNPLYAGGNHDHGHGHSHNQVTLSKDKAKKVAIKTLNDLVKSGKINKSWSGKVVVKSEKKQFHHSKEWVISFKNRTLKDKTKQTLYIFINMHGQSMGANYSGK